MTSLKAPFHLFAQHGWADGNQDMLTLSRQLVGCKQRFSAPNLDYVQTWLRMEPLIQAVEAIATQVAQQQPHRSWRIVGHSMGGVIWLEVLSRHPEWWKRVESLVLVASPVGGADLGRIFDPLGIGVGIAADLGANRRAMAESVAAQIPTLAIAGDCDGGSDGTIPVMATQFAHAQFVCLPGIAHAELKTHPQVVSLIQEFWLGEAIGEPLAPDSLIQMVRSIPGITDGHLRNFDKANVWHAIQDGRTLRIWISPMGIPHIFLASPDGLCLYAGFVGWLHIRAFWTALESFKSETHSCHSRLTRPDH